MDQDSFYCSDCGIEHAGLPTDWGFNLPDEVHALSFLEKYARCRYNEDLCTLNDSRYFIRGVLPLPIVGAGKDFNWGVWAEVSRETHDLYVSSWTSDISSMPKAVGYIANEIAVYGDAFSASIEIQFNSGTDRPSFFFSMEVNSEMALEQRNGITKKRQHDILAGLGCFEGDDV